MSCSNLLSCSGQLKNKTPTVSSSTASGGKKVLSIAVDNQPSIYQPSSGLCQLPSSNSSSSFKKTRHQQYHRHQTWVFSIAVNKPPPIYQPSSPSSSPNYLIKETRHQQYHPHQTWEERICKFSRSRSPVRRRSISKWWIPLSMSNQVQVHDGLAQVQIEFDNLE